MCVCACVCVCVSVCVCVCVYKIRYDSNTVLDPVSYSSVNAKVMLCDQDLSATVMRKLHLTQQWKEAVCNDNMLAFN